MRLERIIATDHIGEGLSAFIAPSGMVLTLRDGRHCVRATFSAEESQQLARAIDGMQDLPALGHANADQTAQAHGAPVERVT